MVTHVTRTIVILLCANDLPCSFHILVLTNLYVFYVSTNIMLINKFYHSGFGNSRIGL